MNVKETWIDATLDSLDGILPARTDDSLYDRVMSGTANPVVKTNSIGNSYFWSAAAGILLLISLNILFAFYYRHAQVPSPEVPAAMANEYLSYLGHIKL